VEKVEELQKSVRIARRTPTWVSVVSGSSRQDTFALVRPRFRRRISSDHPRDDLLKPRLGTEHIERRLDHDKREFARVLQGSQRTLDIIERGIDDGDVV
jgi:hypothetical protein